MSRLRVAIATDLHYIKDSSGDSCPQVCSKGSKINPMDSLIDTLTHAALPINPVADLLICPGDITTAACESSFAQGWADLNKLKETLGARDLIAATGNHEIVSRAGKEHLVAGNAELAIEPFDHLIKTINYPASFDASANKWIYWGRGYEVVCGENWVVVIINTCHYHGSLLPNEYERGRIGDLALAELREELKSLSKLYDYRLVLLHHPPLSHEEFNVELGRTSMYNGELLLKAIEETSADWFVVHGHKHHYRLIKSTGAEFSPIVMGAASFGALLTGELASQTKNQFYIVELDLSEDPTDRRLRGRVESINWDGSSWSLCTELGHGLPHGCGFDQSVSVRAANLAAGIKKMVSDSGLASVRWDEVVEQMDILNRLMPKEIENLQRKLTELNVEVVPGKSAWFPTELWVRQ